jgi:hypothetical protein
MKTRRGARAALAFLVTMMAVGVAGCPKDPYRASLSGSAKVADAVAEAVKVSTQYYGTGKINDQEKATIAGYLDKVTDANMKFRHGAEDLHQAGVTGKTEYLGLAQAFINAVPTDPLAFQYKSADSQKKFAEVLGTVKTALNLIQLTLQQAKGV